MKSLLRPFNFNLILVLVLAATGCAGFRNHWRGKQAATIRLYLETGATSDSGTVLVTRNKVPINIQREPFLDESDLAKAKLLDDQDGTFEIELIFTEHGALELDMATVANKGRHIVIFSSFPPPGTKETDVADDTLPSAEDHGDKPRSGGWISAVLIRDRLTGGLLRFIPDTSREEAERIVKGLNNVAAKANSDSNF